MAAYQYQRLQNQHTIRILKLRGAILEDEPLHGSFLVAELKDVSQYDAISYTWGEPDFSEDIHIDGSSLQITPNLSSALKRFRSRINTRLLWIDAICIDQNHVEEKSSQVAMMAQIYRKANKVLGWLSDGDPGTKRALDHLRNVAKAAPDFGLEANISPNAIFIRAPEKRLQGAEDKAEALVKAANEHKVQSIYGRKWFSRIWIIQEVVLAKDLTLHCGESDIEWGVFAAATILLSSAQITVRHNLENSEAFQLARDLVYVEARSMFTLWPQTDQPNCRRRIRSIHTGCTISPVL